MEDFGEYTPLDAHGVRRLDRRGATTTTTWSAITPPRARTPATARRGRWRASTAPAGPARRAHSQIVWGGDPTTGWGFDGLESAIKNGLTMGLSGVSLWGSDIGGFFALSEPQTTPELLARWIEFGFASGVMRTQANGFALPGRPAPADLRPGDAAGLGALREAAHAALPVPRGRPARVRPHRHAADAPPRARLSRTTRARPRARTSTCSAATCWSRRWSRPDERERTLYLPARPLDRLVAVDLARRSVARPDSARRGCSAAAVT